MKHLKASTKAGQDIIARAHRFDGCELSDVYSRYSENKARAMVWCKGEFSKYENAWGFHICSHNTVMFTVAYHAIENGEEIIRYETNCNTYIVHLNQ